mmetsp:Transcript_56436/g.135436  ORF Transcript_56436/g.135436 Transcript_56436/m.135436 type:complete len:230 (-) Transcript_56436:1390-2079(-)
MESWPKKSTLEERDAQDHGSHPGGRLRGCRGGVDGSFAGLAAALLEQRSANRTRGLLAQGAGTACAWLERVLLHLRRHAWVALGEGLALDGRRLLLVHDLALRLVRREAVLVILKGLPRLQLFEEVTEGDAVALDAGHEFGEVESAAARVVSVSVLHDGRSDGVRLFRLHGRIAIGVLDVGERTADVDRLDGPVAVAVEEAELEGREGGLEPRLRKLRLLAHRLGPLVG